MRLTDKDVDAALLAYWKAQDPLDADSVGLDHGNRVARVRMLVERVYRKVCLLRGALDCDDVDTHELRHALERKVDLKFAIGVEEVMEDCWDIVEAVERMPKKSKRRKR